MKLNKWKPKCHFGVNFSFRTQASVFHSFKKVVKYLFHDILFLNEPETEIKPQETCDWAGEFENVKVYDTRSDIYEVSRICMNAILLQGSLAWQFTSRKIISNGFPLDGFSSVHDTNNTVI